MMDLCCRCILGIDVQDIFSMPIGDAINSAMGLEIILFQVSSRQIPLHPARSLYSESALAASLLVEAVARYSRGCFRVCPSRMYDKLIDNIVFRTAAYENTAHKAAMAVGTGWPACGKEVTASRDMELDQ